MQTINKNQLENILKYCDLYGFSIIAKQLKSIYTFVSWCKNSKPTPGSLTLKIDRLNENDDTIIKKYIIHKNLDLTLITNQGYLKFTN